MNEPFLHDVDPLKADIALIAAPYDATSSYGKGAHRGPAIFKECFTTQLEIFEPTTKTEPATTLSIAWDDSLRITELPPEQMITAVGNHLLPFITGAALPITIGGEHSVTIGACRAIAAAGISDLTVLQIDAHADLRDSDADYNTESPSRNAHSCVMRRAHADYGLKTVQVGIRAAAKMEWDYIHENNLTVFPWSANPPAIKEIINSITTDHIYITLDLDGLDPAHTPATGTPVPGGLTWYYTLELLQECFKCKHVMGADIVELCPFPHDHRTEYAAAQLAYTMIGNHLKYSMKKNA